MSVHVLPFRDSIRMASSAQRMKNIIRRSVVEKEASVTDHDDSVTVRLDVASPETQSAR